MNGKEEGEVIAVMLSPLGMLLFFAQVMRMTLSTLNWRRREMVRWLVTCATEVGESPSSLCPQGKGFLGPTLETGQQILSALIFLLLMA